jgi:nicotinamidase-related amidase
MTVKRLNPKRTAFLLIDLQERLLPVMKEKTTLLRRTERLIEGASLLKQPILVTEQYPRGLGHTHGSIASKLHGAVHTTEKTRFSACSGAMLRHLEKFETQSLVVAGIEAHVCVLMTCLDLIEAGYTVAVCLDAVSSRRDIDRKAGIDRMVQAGVVPTTVEAALFELIVDADSPTFKALRGVLQSKDP